MSKPPILDSHDLASFGYKQELHRTLGSFASFAAGFSYLSILTGMFLMFHLGFGAAGPAFFWTWPTVFAGQFLVALGFAELASRYPLSGGLYHWSKHIGTPALGWMAGWIYLACQVVTLAAVALALQNTLPQISSVFQLVGSGSSELDRAQNAVVLGCIVIGFSTLINAFGVRLLAGLNVIGVCAEILGALLLICLLGARGVRSPPSFLTDTQGHGSGEPLGYLLPFVAAAAMTASFVLYGFDTAASLAEETREPRRTAPLAILQSLSSCAAAGLFIILTALMAASDLQAPALSSDGGGLSYIVKETLGDTVGKFLIADVVIAITACTLAVHACLVRVTFAMARDNNLPFGTFLARVSKRSLTPITPALLGGVLAIGILLVNVDFPKVVGVVSSVAILWANLAYLLVTVALLAHRLRSPLVKTHHHTTRLFSLGRWGLPINLLATAWSLFTVVNVGWPRPEVYGDPWYLRYGAVLYTGGLVAFGSLYYALVQRHKTGILAEHQASEVL
jgi:urea carboxylase system permease